MKVKSLTLKKFRNDEWLEFMEHIIDLVKDNDCIKGSDSFEALADACSDFKRMISLDCKVDGMTVSNADRAADQAWSCLNAQLKVALVHPDENHRNAAARIYVNLLKYGNPTRLTYDQEYAKLRMLLEDLSKNTESDLKLTHSYDWFKALQQRCDYFMEVYRKRIEHSTSIDPGAVKVARMNSEYAYKGFIEYVQATSLLASDASLDELISCINAQIEMKKAEFRKQTTKPGDVIEIPETIDDMDMDEDELVRIHDK